MFLNLNAIHFSIILEINGKFEIGRKLSKLNGSAPDFLSMGVIIADLKNDGTEPETSEALTILVINGDKFCRIKYNFLSLDYVKFISNHSKTELLLFYKINVNALNSKSPNYIFLCWENNNHIGFCKQLNHIIVVLL